MCGFIAWFKPGREKWTDEERKTQARALAALQHRGPDDCSEYVDDGVWIGFQRLAILDLSDHGRQPMAFAGGRYHLAFNGEIYNFRELRQQQGLAGLQSTGDSAVLGELLTGRDLSQVVPLLRGMFSFLWYDSRDREASFTRDPFGIKPLYFQHTGDGSLRLASELRAVAMLGTKRGAVSHTAIAQYFRWGSIQDPLTIYEGIHSVMPGEIIRWRDGHLSKDRPAPLRWGGSDGWIRDRREEKKAVSEALQRSVSAHMIADVQVGVFLSGGLDSSLLVALMSKVGAERIQAFSIGFEDGSGVPDETGTAGLTAAHFGCNFNCERIGPAQLLSCLDDYFRSLDQPSGDALNTWLVSRMAANHVKVALSGLGADEWFGGYNHLRLASLAAGLATRARGLSGITGQGIRWVDSRLPEWIKDGTKWKAAYYAAGGAGTDPLSWHNKARTILATRELSDLLGRPEAEVVAATEASHERIYLASELDHLAPDSWLNQMLMLETHTYLRNTLLRDNDSTSMSHGLELRVPFVDREIFSLAEVIQPSSKLSLNGGKLILREAFSDLLPEWILNDQKKKTFTLPLMKWMREPGWRERIHDTLSSQECATRGWFDVDVAKHLLRKYERSSLDDKRGWRLSQSVWMLFVLESWGKGVDASP